MPFKTFVLLLSAFTSLMVVEGHYSNSQAITCYSNSLAKCKKQINECLQSENCENELNFYHKCSFEADPNRQDQIYNGFCFAEWQKNAIHSLDLIDCFVDQCDLTYNSDMSLKILTKCTRYVLIDRKLQCGDDCLQQIGIKIGQRLTDTPIRELYSQEFSNQQAREFAASIVADCLDKNGRFRQQLISRDAAKKVNQSQPDNEQQDEVQQQL